MAEQVARSLDPYRMGVLKKVSRMAEQAAPRLNHLKFPVYPNTSRWYELIALDTRTQGLTGPSAEGSVLSPGRRAPIGRNPI